MIRLSDIRPVGKFMKPHGVNGEIAVLRDSDILDFNHCSCVIVDVDGIFVPFFLNSIRSKGVATDLVGIDGITDERHAAALTNKTVYVLAHEIPGNEDNEDEEDGFYADDFIGYKVHLEDGRTLGEITRIEDSTANYLFVVETTSGGNLLIPVADEFITGIDTGLKVLTMSLPQGLIDIQG